MQLVYLKDLRMELFWLETAKKVMKYLQHVMRYLEH